MKKKILVVDDEPHIVDLIKMTLQNEYELYEAFTSRDAMSQIKKHEPDLILLDIMMPGEDGFQLCDRIRESKKNKNTPIIFISAKNQHEDMMKSIDVGGDDYLTKPFDPEELEKKVKANLIMNKIE
ncbi:MAG: response regulator transcription factor [Candidatus Woesearchaeota archaeon]